MAKRTNTAQWLENQNRWQINVQKDGVRRSFTSSTPGRTGQREANAKADAWLDNNVVDPNIKVSKLYEEYFAELQSVYSWAHCRPIASRWSTWILPTIGNIKISALNEQHLQRVINAAFVAGRSRKTIKNLRSDMSAFLKYCRKCRYTTLFPENVTIPKDADYKQKQILLPEDLQILFSSDETTYFGKPCKDRLINAYRFQVLTGLRPGELLGLEWGDIDWKKGTVHIQRSINYLGVTTKGKNKTANRTFVLSRHAAQVLEDQRNINAFGKVFGEESQVVYYKNWQRYCEHNGITKTSAYELRHTFVSVSAEMPEGMLQKLVGHTQNMDSFGTYGHSYANMQQQIADKSTEIWDKILKKAP